MTREVVTLLLLCFIAFTSIAKAQEASNNTVKVTLYYESLCPDSIGFITNELYPTWLNLKDYFSIDWVPYGKATHRKSEGGSWTFRCQHGAPECRGNMLQACAIDSLTSSDDVMKFIKCAMSSPAPQSAGQACSTEVGVNYSPIQTCTQSEKGKNLLAQYGDRTHALTPTLSFVPTIVFNDRFNSDLQRRSLRDFKGALCSLLNPAPSACSK